MTLQESCACAGETILVVDDEESIRRSLERVLADEGFRTLQAGSGEEALAILKKVRPALVLLDIWMPGLDGIETLKQIKAACPDLPVIMISGHATIATAMHATRLGASDFIEKPLDLEGTLNAVKKVMGQSPAPSAGRTPAAAPRDNLMVGIRADVTNIRPAAFAYRGWPGAARPQRTLARSAVLYGHGVHTGQKSGLILEPLPPDCGIHFSQISEVVPVPAHLDYVESTGYATTIKDGQLHFGTIEHLMSALHAYGITNLLIKCNGEVPVMDGSTLEFCELIEQVGLEEQSGEWREIEVRHAVECAAGQEQIRLEPYDGFMIDYTLEYPPPVGHQRLVFTLAGPESYKREIAPARTFGFVRDIGALQKAGLALGGRFDNFVLIGEEGAINAQLRFPDEAVRHKILDIIGDAYLLGRPIRGKITAHMTGHADNVELLRRLKAELLRDVQH